MAPVKKGHTSLFGLHGGEGQLISILKQRGHEKILASECLRRHSLSSHGHMGTDITNIYYPLEVSSMKYCCLGVLRKEYLGSTLNSANREITLKYWYNWVVKIRNTSEAVLGQQYTPWPDRGPMSLGQYNSLGE